MLRVSKKVMELVSLLNKEMELNKQPPKVIIFVKDRIIAFYLKKILEEQSNLRKENRHHFDDKKLLHAKYHVEMAMGPRGKNLVNRAYKSTKPSAMDN